MTEHQLDVWDTATIEHDASAVSPDLRTARQAYGELAAFLKTVAVCAHRSAVHFHQAAHQRQSNSKAAAGVRLSRRGLMEHLECVNHGLGRHPDSRVAHANDDVAEQVAQDLIQADRIHFQPQRFCRQG